MKHTPAIFFALGLVACPNEQAVKPAEVAAHASSAPAPIPSSAASQDTGAPVVAATDAGSAVKPEPGSPIPGCLGDCNPDGDEGDNAVTGTWKISGFVLSTASTVDAKTAQKNVGKMVNVGRSLETPWLTCSEARWSLERTSLDAWLADWKAPKLGPAQAKLLGVAKKKELSVWNGKCSKPTALAMQIVQGDDTLLMAWDGATYAMRRSKK